MKVKLVEGGVVLDGAEVLRELADLTGPAHRPTLNSLASLVDVELAIPIRVTVANISVGIGSAAPTRGRDAVGALLRVADVLDRHAAGGGFVDGTSAWEIHEIITEWKESQG